MSLYSANLAEARELYCRDQFWNGNLNKYLES